MENMVVKNLFNNIYADKTVLITGHTGFKGSWLASWLTQLGAKVIGYSLDIPTEPNHFQLLNIEDKLTHILGDIKDLDKLNQVFKTHQPDIVFHLAAQSLVRPSYEFPIDTFHTNVVGSANVFEASRLSGSVVGIVNVTSDKCYENFEDDRPYKEDDRMGGYDPYSASKGAAELIANSYRSSFFNADEFGETHNIILASVRAGNVIGGGDWSDYRLIPDIIKAASTGKITSIRSPHSTRPWQHVLEPLSGYLLIGQHILEGNLKVSDGWNFGPKDNETLTVGQVIEMCGNFWDKVKYEINLPKNMPHEAKLLRLDCSKSKNELAWESTWNSEEAILKTIEWYKIFSEENILKTKEQIDDYVAAARSKKLTWTMQSILK